MNTKNLTKGTFNIFCLVLFLSLKSWSQTTPNILFILTDDHGYADVGFNNGAADIATPNLDALAANGTVFSSAYVTHPFCGPSRAGLMTGRYPHTIGAQFNLSDSNTTQGVEITETFMSTALQTAGYNTGVIGKWHLGQPDGYRPNQRGFDYFYGMLYGGHVYFTGGGGGSTQYRSPLRENEGLAGEANGLYVTDLFTDKGVEFINNAETNDNDPFFLFMSYNAPHTPLQALQSDKDILTNDFGFTYTDTKRHDYAAMVYSVDRGIKKLVDALTANGELNNTLIVFLSDNGGRTDQGALNTPLRGRKGDTFEGGFRVPMMMHWPGGNIPAGATYDYNVSALDLYPTFVNAAGGSIPAGKTIDGKDILSNIIANTDPRAGESIYSIRHRTINNVGIRRDNLKAYTTGNGVWFLYDLENNLSENNAQNLANDPAYKNILEEMTYDAYQWSLTHIEPQFFDSSGAQTTWFNNHSSTNPANTTSWQDTGFEDFTTPPALSIDTVEFKQNALGYVYPNPISVDSQLHINFNETLTDSVDVIIYNSLGQAVQMDKNLTKSSANAVILTVKNDLKPGNYYIKIISGIKTLTKSIIIE